MKKVLLGLVIAVMMTGNGHSTEASKDVCNWLKEKAVNLSFFAYAQDRTADKLMNEPKNEMNDYSFKLNREGQLARVKDAHYYAVTWSALCD